MANRHRGEVEGILDGRPHTLCLTLGALAGLEAAFGASDLAALADRLGSGRLSATDVRQILYAGLMGAGYDYTPEEVAEMHIDGGAAGFVRLVVDLLAATFTDPSASSGEGASHPPRTARGGGPIPPAHPFPGKR